MRTAVVFVAGILIGVLTHAAGAQQRPVEALNHVALAVDNFEEASRFYIQVMGFPEAFAFREPDGKPALSYSQINRSTFIELMPVTATRPAGFVHFGLEVSDLDATVRRLTARGLAVSEPIVSARTKSRIAVASTPQGAGVELLEFGPESLHRKVMEQWK